MQYNNPKNRTLVKEALQMANRLDLIGNDSKCLLRLSQGPKASGTRVKGKVLQKDNVRKDTRNSKLRKR